MVRLPARTILTETGRVHDSALVVDDGIIVAIEPFGAAAPDRLLAPGFVDLQVNGIDDIDVATAGGDDWAVLDRHLLAQGVTTWCPTLITSRLTAYPAPLERIATAMARDPRGRPTIAGAHLEGPFLGGAPGAHRRELIIPIDHDWIASLPDHVTLMTLGAEQADVVDAVQALIARGITVSIGHSIAGDVEFDAVAAAGATLVTHLFNGMSGLHHRTPGVAAWAITNDAVSASIIADGIHVHPRMIDLAFRALGAKRCILVTDAVAWRAGTAGPVGIELRDGAPRLPDGTLAGSALTMDAAIRTCVSAGISLDDALRAASTNPARLLGLDDRGSIAVGRRADVVAITPQLGVEQTWIAGEPTI
jgi:N-acetylglucosamine-6-phosphate deacetylase